MGGSIPKMFAPPGAAGTYTPNVLNSASAPTEGIAGAKSFNPLTLAKTTAPPADEPQQPQTPKPVIPTKRPQYGGYGGGGGAFDRRPPSPFYSNIET